MDEHGAVPKMRVAVSPSTETLWRKDPLFSLQYHPDASAGPHDRHYRFETFQKLLEERFGPPPRRGGACYAQIDQEPNQCEAGATT